MVDRPEYAAVLSVSQFILLNRVTAYNIYHIFRIYYLLLIGFIIYYIILWDLLLVLLCTCMHASLTEFTTDNHSLPFMIHDIPRLPVEWLWHTSSTCRFLRYSLMSSRAEKRSLLTTPRWSCSKHGGPLKNKISPKLILAEQIHIFFKH